MIPVFCNRWGDKIREMKLVGLGDYLKAIEDIVTEHSIDKPYIYLTTETFEAYNAFSAAMNDAKYANWTLLNYRHSLAGKGSVSGYNKRNPAHFSNFPSKNAIALAKNNTPARTNVSHARGHAKRDKWHRAGSNNVSATNSERKTKVEVGEKRRLENSGKGAAIRKKHSAAREINFNRKSKNNHAPLPPKKSGGYKITPAVRAISPMALAKKGTKSLGRHSLIALLIAMEATHYILTTGSNWSRLINELRINVMERKCSSPCTTMTDLMKGDSPDYR